MAKLCVLVSAIVVGFFVHLFHEANMFTDLSSLYQSKLKNCVHIKDIGSIEHIALDKSSGIAILPSSDLVNYFEKNTTRYDLAFYKIDLNKEEFNAEKLEVVGVDMTKFNVLHGTDWFTDKDGRSYIFVVSHTSAATENSEGEYVHILEFKDNKLYYIEGLTDKSWTSVNDVVAVGPRSFYITIDHMFPRTSTFQIIEEWLAVGTGSIIFFDGSVSQTVASGIPYANGIAISNDFKMVYVGSPVVKKLFIYSRDVDTNKLTSTNQVALNTFIDNISVDSDDSLWIAAYPQNFKFLLSVRNITYCPTEILKAQVSNNGEKVDFDTYHFSGGVDISGTAVAVKYQNRVVLSSVIHSHLMYCSL